MFFGKNHLVLLVSTFWLSCGSSPKNLHVPVLFSDGMVIQRDTTVAIWGGSTPETNVYLYPSWGKSITIKSDKDGRWETYLETTSDQNVHSLQIKSGKDKIFINDILLGEVWLASGQSNMEMDFDYCCNSTDSAQQVLSNDIFNNIRMFNVKKRYSLHPSSDIDLSLIHI